MSQRNEITLVVPYYNNPAMLAVQADAWLHYPEGLRVVVVDDGSALAPAEGVLEPQRQALERNVALYRVEQDIPWNRGGARNLGAHVAGTEWVLHVDIDHLLTPACAAVLMVAKLDARHWYRFQRFRNGRADATRRKDAIPDDMPWGPVKPHGDSYLVPRALYWQVGGYDEDYSGCLGGGSPFLKQLEAAAPVRMAPLEVSLQVFTRDTCPDASDTTLGRDTSEYTRRRKAKELAGRTKAKNPLRFSWRRVW